MRRSGVGHDAHLAHFAVNLDSVTCENFANELKPSVMIQNYSVEKLLQGWRNYKHPSAPTGLVYQDVSAF